MLLSSVGLHSLHSEGLRAVLVRSTNTSLPSIKMKYAVFFLLFCVAMAAAAPQLIAGYPGFVAPGFVPYGARTLVAGPTVVNNPLGFGARYIAPGYVGPAFI